MKASVFVAFVFATVSATHASFAADHEDRPAGVEAQHWLPVSDRLGFVIVPEKHWPPAVGGSRELLLADPDGVSADLQPPKKGYFVIKTEAGWQRVVVAAPSELAG